MPEDKIQFSFELIDEVSDSAKKIEQSLDSADRKVEDYTADAEKASNASQKLDRDVQATQLQLVTQMAAIGSLDGAVRGLAGSMTGLGLISDETAQDLNKVVSAFGLIKSTAQGLTAVKGLMATLNAQTAINASLSSYLAVLKNPAMMAGVGLAAGAAVGIAGAYLMTNNNNSTTNNSTTIQIENSTPTATSNFTRLVEGGAL